MKIVYSDPKTGRTGQAEVPADRSATLMNMKIGEQIDGSIVGLTGYKLKITGGSDNSGFPMIKGVEGTRKAHVLSSVAMSGRSRGMQKRKSVRGNTTSADTMQINTVIVEYGERPITDILPEKVKEKKEEAPKEEQKK